MNSTGTPAMPADQVEALIERHVLERIAQHAARQWESADFRF